jgi:transposase
MAKILKQVVGLDVDKKNLVVGLGRLNEDLQAEVFAHKVFSNNEKGFAGLLSWTRKLFDPTVEPQFVMEATGVYHETLAYYLDGKGQRLSVVLPNKISNYFRTLNVKTVTDKTCSEAIARFGLERKLDLWVKPDPVLKIIKQLSRERDQIISERTLVKNQLHAEQSEVLPNNSSIARMNQRITLLNKQEKQIKDELAALIKQDEKLKANVELISSIPGVATLTAATILAETNGFTLIRSRRQLTSYAGLDVREKQSGTSVKGKPRISKRGNRYLRKSMHMPALTAIRHDTRFKALFARLVSKHGIKMKAVVVVQRKILELAFTLHKNRTTYDQHYLGPNPVVHKIGKAAIFANSRPSYQADIKPPSDKINKHISIDS